jgi:phosphatidylglycerophosphate synthase
MHKIPIEYESPIDGIMLKLSEKILPFLKQTNHTPNIITTYSLVTGLLSVYYLNQNNLYYFVPLYLASYFFDCVDGHFARTYKMFSRFGDLYDHASDIFVGGYLFYIVVTKFNHRITYPIILVWLSLTYLCFIHTGCRQRLHNKPDAPAESLDALQSLCKNPQNIQFYKYFGTGSYIVFCIALVIYIAKKN